MFNQPIRDLPYTFYVGLPSQVNPKVMQSNPTLASGDAKVSKDGGALANLATLPDVDPDSGKLVKVTLSATEMGADNVTVILSDASGDEWCDVVINLRPLSGILTGSAVNDASATTTAFVTDLTEATDDHYNGMVLVFTSGACKGQARKISDYVGSTKVITLAAALTDAPADNDEFVILGRIE